MHLNDHDITGSVRTTDPVAVGGEVCRIYRELYPRTSAAPLERAFIDASRIYYGGHPEYLPCDTEYHDIQHVLDVTLAMARLMHGYERGRQPGEEPIERELFIVGALAALFHDFGYLRKRHDRRHRFGAEYTLVHVSRGAAFLRRYVRDLGLGEKLARLASTLVHFTGYERPAESIRIAPGLPRRIGQMLGSADIIAQMSDRCYLEKCRDRLYPEFVLGTLGAPAHAGRRLPVFESGQDLVNKTPGFYEGARRRLDLQLARAYEYAGRHFGGDNLYLQGMEKNIRYAANAARVLRRQPPHTLLPDVQPYPRDLLGLSS
jgi:hypothetical protein